MICDEVESGLAALHLLAESVANDLACVYPLAAQPVAALAQRLGSFPALMGLPTPNGRSYGK